MLTRQQFEALWATIAQTAIRDEAVVVGSAALYLYSKHISPMTHDLDIIVPVATLVAHGQEMTEQLERTGFSHVPDTATYVASDGSSFDVLGTDQPGQGDRVAHLPSLAVMVFEDLCVLAANEAIEEHEGKRVLSAAGLVWSKLLTLRLEKGAKDKLQALALIDEQSTAPHFDAQFKKLSALFSAMAREDALAEAQAAFASLEHDEYASLRVPIERGLTWLTEALA